MKKLGLIHTVLFLADHFKQKLALRYPDLNSFHIVNESLLQDLIRAGGLTPGIIRRIMQQAQVAADAGAEVILFTCSSTSPAIDKVRPLLDIPILKIDDPMAEKAVAIGQKIGVICTASSTFDASKNLILSHAARIGKEVEVKVHLEADAFDAIMSGDKAKHDDLVTKAALELGRESDVLVLAQASMGHLAPDLIRNLPIQVLTSMDLCVEALAQNLEN